MTCRISINVEYDKEWFIFMCIHVQWYNMYIIGGMEVNAILFIRIVIRILYVIFVYIYIYN